MVPNAHITYTYFYCAQLGQMYTALDRKHPPIINQKHVLLQQDNGKLYTACQMKDKYAECN